MKRKFLKISLLLMLSLHIYALPAWGSKNHKITTIVLDPGHGGIDSGALGKFSKEKDISLSVTLKLGKLIKSKYKNVNVIYTRSTDKTVPLHQRANLSNKSKADLLLSIHCNACTNKQANGIETITMSLKHYNRKTSTLAARENSVIKLEKNYKEIYKNFNIDSQEFNILNSLVKMSTNYRSIEIARNVQNELVSRTKKKSRGIKQENLLLLYMINAPSVLIEIGFLTNPEEENYLNSKQGQDTIALAILEGIAKYKDKLEKNDS
jgi:N-acetylmuramoyl-L-alanine amidase